MRVFPGGESCSVIPGGESVHTGVGGGAVDERALEQINGHLHRFFIGTVLFLYWHLHRVFYWHQFVFLKEDLPARAAEIRGWLWRQLMCLLV